MKPLASYPCKVSSFSPFSVPILLAWSAGFPAGLLLANRLGNDGLLWMRRGAVAPVSIVLLSFALTLPFFLAALAALFSLKHFCAVLAFFRTASFGCCAVLCVRAFEDVGWQILGLLLFPQILSLPLLLFFFLRRSMWGTRFLPGDLGISISAVLLAGLAECWLLAPKILVLAGG